MVIGSALVLLANSKSHVTVAHEAGVVAMSAGSRSCVTRALRQPDFIYFKVGNKKESKTVF